MRHRVLLLILVALLAPAVANAGTSPRVDLSFRFLTSRPGVATALRLSILYKDPGNARAKPPAVRHLDILPPPGTRLDPGALPACDASDAALLALGDAACAAVSRLGGGSLTVFTGIAPLDPLTTDVTVYDTPNGWAEVAKDPHSGRPVGTDRVAFLDGHLVASPPFEPGAPPDGAAVRSVDFTLGPAGGWLVTPTACAGTWTTRATFGFADGSTQAVDDSMPCDRPGAGSPARASPGLHRRSHRHRRRRRPHRRARPRFAG